MMVQWEAQERERVGEPAIKDRDRLGQCLAEEGSKLSCRSLRSLERDLCKDGAKSSGDLKLASLGHVRKDVAEEMHLAPLPTGALKHRRDG